MVPSVDVEAPGGGREPRDIDARLRPDPAREVCAPEFGAATVSVAARIEPLTPAAVGGTRAFPFVGFRDGDDPPDRRLIDGGRRGSEGGAAPVAGAGLVAGGRARAGAHERAQCGESQGSKNGCPESNLIGFEIGLHARAYCAAGVVGARDGCKGLHTSANAPGARSNGSAALWTSLTRVSTAVVIAVVATLALVESRRSRARRAYRGSLFAVAVRTGGSPILPPGPAAPSWRVRSSRPTRARSRWPRTSPTSSGSRPCSRRRRRAQAAMQAAEPAVSQRAREGLPRGNPARRPRASRGIPARLVHPVDYVTSPRPTSLAGTRGARRRA